MYKEKKTYTEINNWIYHCNIYISASAIIVQNEGRQSLSPYRLLFPISSKGSTYYSLWWTSCGPLVGTENSPNYKCIRHAGSIHHAGRSKPLQPSALPPELRHAPPAGCHLPHPCPPAASPWMTWAAPSGWCSNAWEYPGSAGPAPWVLWSVKHQAATMSPTQHKATLIGLGEAHCRTLHHRK